MIRKYDIPGSEGTQGILFNTQRTYEYLDKKEIREASMYVRDLA